MSIYDHTYLHDEINCPLCRVSLNASTSTSGKKLKPEEGDLTVCINCGYVLVFVVSPIGPVGLRAVETQEIKATIQLLSKRQIVVVFNPDEEPLRRLRVVAVRGSLWQSVQEQY